MIYTDEKIEEILYRENIKIPPFSHRIAAFAIDIFLIALITWGLYINLLSTSSSDIQTKIYSIQKLIFIYFVFELSYEIICLRFFGTSIGKMIFGLKIISLLDLDRPVLKTILQRAILKVFEEIFGFVLFIFAIDDVFYRGIHDKISKTLVISDR